MVLSLFLRRCFWIGEKMSLLKKILVFLLEPLLGCPGCRDSDKEHIMEMAICHTNPEPKFANGGSEVYINEGDKND